VRRRFLFLALAVPFTLGISALAYAYFTSSGSGAGAAGSGTLPTPVIASATPGAGTVALSWAPGVTPPAAGTVTYYVTRDGGTPAGNCSTAGSQTTATSCTDTGLAAGTHSFTVTADWLSWSRTSTTTNVTVTSGTASQLVFTTQPAGGVGEATNFTTSPKVSVEDAGGNVVTTDTGSVTLAVASGPAGTLSCSNTGFPTIAAVAGVATFTSCQINGTAAAGTYTLSATRSGLTTATSGSVVINAGTATKLAFTTQPTSGQNIQATGTGTFSTSVAVQDANGNTVTTNNTTTVNLAINNNAGPGGVLTCTNTGGLGPVTVSSGVANFTGCAITKVGTGYTLTASSSPTLTAPANANAFNITAGTATHLVLSGSSANLTAGTTRVLTATVEDAQANTVTSATNNVTFAKTTGPGTVTGLGTTAAVNGVATDTVSGGLIGSVTVQASATGLTSSSTVTFTVTVGTASQLVFTTGSMVSLFTSSTANLGPIMVQEQDSQGNPTTVAETVNLSSTSAGGVFSATLNGTPATSVTIPAGSSSVSFYYGDANAGSPTITASGSLSSDSQGETILL
jgi:hypothetical protein